ncbi:MAG: ribosome silencing factor [Comamonas sp.]
MTTSETAAKKDIQKLQRAIVDGLEDVKAQNLAVFNTEHLSPLFERVIVASGTSNRQTKALAASVRDAIRDAGFNKPRIEGEENGEWIIVDAGPAVVHIMQPAIREYYRLEEIWGEKPVRLKHGADKAAPAAPAEKAPAKKAAPRKTAAKATATAAAEAPAKPARKTAAAKTASAAAQAPAASAAPAKKAAAKKPAVKKPAVKAVAAAKPAAKPAVKKPALKAPAKPAARKTAKPS